MLESDTWLKADEKAREFLRQVMGDDVFNKFTKDGKIEIKSDKNLYELYYDGRIINKSTNQNYCVVPTRSDYPTYDVIAIKYSWLKYNADIIEKVANKSTIYGTGRDARREGLGYDAFVHHMESAEWIREQIIINEKSHFVTACNSECENTSTIIEIKCPPGRTITLMGTSQIPDPIAAHTFSLYITDNDGKEISGHTRIRISKMSSTGPVIELVRCFYHDLSYVNRIDENGILRHKTFAGLYRWRQGIMLNEGCCLNIQVINPGIKIDAKNIKLKMDADFWTR